jgi:RNA 2',3'-cyclic 3'-phosphodiesterase
MLRLFIAVDLPVEIRADVEALMGHLHNARWVNPEQLHITLRFLGDTPEDALPAIRDGLARVKQDCFPLRLRGVGVFPESRPGRSRKPPRVLWLGIESAGELASLKQAIDAALGAEPTQNEQAFSPHLTLARFPRPPDQTLADFLATHRGHQSPEWTVAGFRLYQSTLRKEGSVHTVVASYPLAGAAREERASRDSVL